MEKQKLNTNILLDFLKAHFQYWLVPSEALQAKNLNLINLFLS